MPATIMDVTMTAATAITPANITTVDGFSLPWCVVSAGVGSSERIVSSG